MDASDTVQWMRIGLKPDDGYRIHFEEVSGRFATGKHWPGHGEQLLPTEDIAWAYAKALANEHTRGRFVNIYVVDRHFYPVPGYEKKEITNRHKNWRRRRSS